MEILLELYDPEHHIETDAVLLADHLRSSSLECYLYGLTNFPELKEQASVKRGGRKIVFEKTRKPSKITVQLIGGEPEVLKGLNYISHKFHQHNIQTTFLRIGEYPRKNWNGPTS